MIIFYIKIKIRAGGGNLRAAGGSFGAAGCSPLLFLFMGNTTKVVVSFLVSEQQQSLRQIFDQ